MQQRIRYLEAISKEKGDDVKEKQLLQQLLKEIDLDRLKT